MPIRFLLLGLCCLFGAAHAAPAPTTTQPAMHWFSVEVLVFRYAHPVAVGNETWPPSVPAPSLAHTVYPTAAATGAYSALDGRSAAVVMTERRLEAAGIYDIVAETGWRQPADSAQTVSVAPIPASAAAASAAGYRAGSFVKLDGTTRLQLSGANAYVALNLRLCEPVPPGIVVRAANPATAADGATAAFPAPDETAAQGLSTMQSGTPCFALNEIREVTPGQFEYFDTPIFGALVMVQTITSPTNPSATPPAASTPVQSPAPGSP
ncbi:MAG: CsiV family protein [Gammaproteobacteria bacterium]